MKTQLIAVLFALCPIFLFSNEDVAGFHCPDDVWVGCDAELWDLDIYGTAYYVDYNGYHHYAGQSWDTHHLNNCGTGYITRKWTYEDQYWNTHTCTQTIWVEGGSFNYHNIHWPKDIVLEGCENGTEPDDLPYGHNKPTYDYVKCSQVGVNFEDDVFHFGPDCLKIIRTWTIIDWCVYDPNWYGSSQGYYTHVQIIKISNSDVPNLYCPHDVKIESKNCKPTYVEIPTINVGNSKCGDYYSIVHNSKYATHAGADASGTYPIGTTTVTFTVEYGCGGQTSCTMNVTVKDDSAPVAYCYASLTVSLMPMDTNGDGKFDEGMVEIWAKDFDKDSYHPCGYGPLHYSFSPDIKDTNATFTCDNVGSNEVSMYVTGPNGASSYCIVELIVQNNFPEIPNCEEQGAARAYVDGRVSSPTGEGIEDANIYLGRESQETVVTEDVINEEYIETITDSFYNSQGHLIFTYVIDTIFTYSYDTTYVDNQIIQTTNENGDYIFEDVTMNEMMFLKPEKAECDMSKITLADAQVMHAYITGAITFDHPYLFLAADVDDSYSVDFDDLMFVIRYLTEEIRELPCDEPYWFVQDGTSMEGDPFEVAINDPIEVMMNEAETQTYNLVAIMKGDIDALIDESLLAEIIANSPIQSLDAVTDVNDITTQNSIHVSPNPMGEYADVIINTQTQGEHKLTVHDLTGKVIFQDMISKSGEVFNYRLDRSNLISGAYILKIDTNEHSWSKKLIVD